MKDLTVSMENRPGTLADVGEALGRAGINIEGGCGMPCEGKGIGHLLVEDAGAARSAIIEAGIEVLDERDVLVLDIENKKCYLYKLWLLYSVTCFFSIRTYSLNPYRLNR